MYVRCCHVCTDGVLQHYHDSYATYRRVVATFVLGVEAYHQERYCNIINCAYRILETDTVLAQAPAQPSYSRDDDDDDDVDCGCCCCSFVDAMPLLCTSCHHNRLLTRGQDNVSRGLSPELLAYYRRQCLLVNPPPPPPTNPFFRAAGILQEAVCAGKHPLTPL